MKMKLITLLTLIVLGVVSQGFSAEGSKTARTPNTVVGELVKEKIAFPTFLKKEGVSKTQIIVQFKVKEDGTLDIINTNQQDERVKKYVLEQMENIQILDVEYDSKETYFLKLNFELL